MAKDTKKEKAKKDNKKNGKIAKKRRSPAAFFKDVISELKKVTWPTKKEIVKYTAAVIVFVLLFAIIVGGVDFLLTEAVALIAK